MKIPFLANYLAKRRAEDEEFDREESEKERKIEYAYMGTVRNNHSITNLEQDISTLGRELSTLFGNVADIRENYGATIHKTKKGLGALYERVNALEKHTVGGMAGNQANAKSLSGLTTAVTTLTDRLLRAEQVLKTASESIDQLSIKEKGADAWRDMCEKLVRAICVHLHIVMNDDGDAVESSGLHDRLQKLTDAHYKLDDRDMALSKTVSALFDFLSLEMSNDKRTANGVKVRRKKNK